MKFFPFIVLVFCSACESTKSYPEEEKEFEPVKWAIQQNHDYPYRNSMLSNLIKYHLPKGERWEEIIKKLGPPTRMDNYHVFYRVSEEKLLNLPVPIHTKTLVIKFTADSLLEWRKIHE